mmetsp:Transcript_18254/g.27932  ORF Transcript_18254/g.27932 Transcript_18254/m.27932 type:complete len:354 (+) Transcript_18254:59-1120(+)
MKFFFSPFTTIFAACLFGSSADAFTATRIDATVTAINTFSSVATVNANYYGIIGHRFYHYRSTTMATTTPSDTMVRINSHSSSSTTTTRLMMVPSRRDYILTNAAAIVTGVTTSTTDKIATSAAAVGVCEVEGTEPKNIFKQPCFTGVWTDPKHPNGYRVVIRKSATVANMFLSDGIRVAGDEFYKNIPVKVKDNSSKSDGIISFKFDFSFKEGGPKKDMVGILGRDGNSITFPDDGGNVWTKNAATSVEGVYATDPKVAGQGNHVIVIRKAQPQNFNDNALVVKMNEEQTILAKIINSNSENNAGVVDIRFKFPDNKLIDATYKDGIILFPFPVQSNAYGNKITKWDQWTKL